ncbi:MAG: glycerol-3-phosphate dehydrogenase/oxidase [Pedobacter sp.]|nr:MAG: glycerol-3-phosphate dehydrogenase/oxidase [Pedobacter sp.]
MTFNRETFLDQLEHRKDWDVIIIGGGATGLGVAVDSATRGYRTLLLEQSDFAKGTSSRSTKLVHGGVRYLAQGDIALVYEALHERGLLLKNAPHLVKDQEFIIPIYSWFSKYKYLVGLKFYDLLAGRSGFGKSSFLNKAKVLEAIPGLKDKGLIGGVRYSDGQFDDARLALNLAQTAAENGGVILNYMKVTSLTKSGEIASGVQVEDVESGKSYSLNAKTIVNATGVFVDEILKMDTPAGHPLVRPSQGAHIVLDPSFLKGNVALMIPKTTDGRVLFAVPWHGKVLVGTTDTPLNAHSLEPVALDQEVDFILATAGQYLTRTPTKQDVLSVFAGLRPLAAPGKDTNSTKEISRSHKLIVANSGLITITGGKWTTYRKMAMDVVDKAIELAQLPEQKCITQNVHIHGYKKRENIDNFTIYGADADGIRKLMKENPMLTKPLNPAYNFIKAEIVWMVRNEMARTIEDVLARRMRILFLDAKAAIALAPAVAEIMANELGNSKEWIDHQLMEFNKLAKAYLLYEVFSPQQVVEVAG